MPTYLYRVVTRWTDKPRLARAEVVKRTDKQVKFASRVAACDHYAAMAAGEVERLMGETPEAAVEKWRAAQRAAADVLQKQADACRALADAPIDMGNIED